MKSMTGFGQSQVKCLEDQRLFKVEIATVNRKQFDLRVSLPPDLSINEYKIRKIISRMISRGTVTVRVELIIPPETAAGTLSVNKSLLTALVNECREIQHELNLDAQIDLSTLLTLPGIIQENNELQNCPACQIALEQAVEQATEKLLMMREIEGKELKQHLMNELQQLKNLTEQLISATATLPEYNREKLLRRIKEAGLELQENDERINREIVIFADRYDVSEEIARLQSHFAQFITLLNNDTEPVGRSLEFVIQEIQREITTLGNKTASCDVSPLVVAFKGTLEKIREQVMNIE